jgi:hypothetical protein
MCGQRREREASFHFFSFYLFSYKNTLPFLSLSSNQNQLIPLVSLNRRGKKHNREEGEKEEDKEEDKEEERYR